MISDTKKFIFVHIPKSGGTSVNSALKEYCDMPPELEPGVRNEGIPKAYEKHNTLLTIKNENIDIDKYLKFSIIRNPWDRIVSFYFHRIQLISRDVDTQQKDFSCWFDNVFLDIKTNRYWANQIDYISIDGKIAINYLIRFENLQNGWRELCSNLNIEKELPHTYKTNHKPYYEYYDERTKEIIHGMFMRDIVTFGYKFGN